MKKVYDKFAKKWVEISDHDYEALKNSNYLEVYGKMSNLSEFQWTFSRNFCYVIVVLMMIINISLWFISIPLGIFLCFFINKYDKKNRKNG